MNGVWKSEFRRKTMTVKRNIMAYKPWEVQENNKKFEKICIISIIFRIFAVKLYNKTETR